MRNKRIAIIVFLSIILLAASATGCSAPDERAEYVVYYAVSNGVTDESDWIALCDGKWENSDYESGVYVTEEKSQLKFYKRNEKESCFSGVLSAGIVTIQTENGTKFYYAEKFSEKDVISIRTVYELATELGYSGTLEELIEAFKGDSAYDIAKKNGYEGTETEWLASLVGASGVTPSIKGGIWYIGDTSTGVRAEGEKGENGRGIEKIEDVSEDGNGGKYCITYTDGTTYSFVVRMGKDGADGKDGKGIANITKTDTAGQVDVYTITMTDGSFYTFRVTNDTNAPVELTAQNLFDFMQSNGYKGTYEDFALLFAEASKKDVKFITKALLSSVSVVAGDSSNGGSGSGIIYKIDKTSGDAYILTNYHVVYNEKHAENASDYHSKIKVYLYGSEVRANEQVASLEMGLDANFIGGSKQYDIALLKITGSEAIKNTILTAAEFVDSDDVYVGQEVIAVGNVEGNGIAVTDGTINVASENISILAVDSSKGYVARRVIRVSAAVNPGNSGGGLFDTDGKVIGLVDAKLVAEKVENIGYAIPSNVVKTVADNIFAQYEAEPTKTHRLYRPLVGMTIYVYSSEPVVNTVTGGVYVKETIKVHAQNENALCSGTVKAGDIIKYVKIGDGEKKEVRHIYTLTDGIMGAKVGDVIEFYLDRDGEAIVASVTVDESAMEYAD